jgi:hypothetical protein
MVLPGRGDRERGSFDAAIVCVRSAGIRALEGRSRGGRCPPWVSLGKAQRSQGPQAAMPAGVIRYWLSVSCSADHLSRST